MAGAMDVGWRAAPRAGSRNGLPKGWVVRCRERAVSLGRQALPQSCTLCAAHAGVDLVCDPCVEALLRNAQSCPQCASPLAAGQGEGQGQACRACAAMTPAFDATEAAFVYAFPLDRLIQACKYNGNLSLTGWFAEQMIANRAVLPAADVIVAMPLAPKRQRQRGFNHALEIARGLSRHTGIPLEAESLRRVRETPAQATLPWIARAINVSGAFAADASFRGKVVIVVDDVMTTGASLDEVARTLKGAGATRVENWLVARTPPPADD